jgi:5-methylcytosine-specific restriction endonuclease McrA
MRGEVQQETRLAIWRRDGGRCVVCGEHAAEMHEIIPKSALPGVANLPILFSNKNCCCLCKDHHNDHTHTKWARQTLLGLLKMRYGYDYSELPFRRYF